MPPVMIGLCFLGEFWLVVRRSLRFFSQCACDQTQARRRNCEILGMAKRDDKGFTNSVVSDMPANLNITVCSVPVENHLNRDEHFYQVR